MVKQEAGDSVGGFWKGTCSASPAWRCCRPGGGLQSAGAGGPPRVELRAIQVWGSSCEEAGGIARALLCHTPGETPGLTSSRLSAAGSGLPPPCCPPDHSLVPHRSGLVLFLPFLSLPPRLLLFLSLSPLFSSLLSSFVAVERADC